MSGKLITTGAICFVLGFVSSKFLSQKSTNPIINPSSIATQAVRTQNQFTQTTENITRHAESNPNPHPTKTDPEKLQTQPNTSAKSQVANADRDDSKTAITGAANKLKFTQRTELSDESIDQLVPKPFNNSVKHLQPELKAKFANYLLSENQSDSDKQAELFLNDALNRSQLAGIAEVSFIGCKAGLCEVRLFEQANSQTLPALFKQLTPYGDYFRDAATSSTSDGQQTSIHYLVTIKQ